LIKLHKYFWMLPGCVQYKVRQFSDAVDLVAFFRVHIG